MWRRRNIRTMVTRNHDMFLSSIRDGISVWRHLLVSSSDTPAETRELALRVKTRGQTRIEFPPDVENQKRKPMDPDESYGLAGPDYPGLVIEISYSQKRKALRKRAWRFIQDSDCQIATVIGIDMDYRDTEEATFSVWRQHRPENAQGRFDFGVLEVVLDKVWRITRKWGDASKVAIALLVVDSLTRGGMRGAGFPHRIRRPRALERLVDPAVVVRC